MEILEKLRAQARPEAILGLAGAAVALLAVAGWLYLLRPDFTAYRDLASKRALAAQGVLADPEAAEAQIVQLQSHIEDLENRLYGGSARVPTRETESFVIDSLDRISGQRGTSLVSVKPGEPGTVLMFEELPYDVKVTGPYLSLYEWLQDVENDLRPMVVKQFSMAPARGSDHVSLDLRLVAYRSGGQP